MMKRCFLARQPESDYGTGIFFYASAHNGCSIPNYWRAGVEGNVLPALLMIAKAGVVFGALHGVSRLNTEVV